MCVSEIHRTKLISLVVLFDIVLSTAMVSSIQAFAENFIHCCKKITIPHITQEWTVWNTKPYVQKLHRTHLNFFPVRNCSHQPWNWVGSSGSQRLYDGLYGCHEIHASFIAQRSGLPQKELSFISAKPCALFLSQLFTAFRLKRRCYLKWACELRLKHNITLVEQFRSI